MKKGYMTNYKKVIGLADAVIAIFFAVQGYRMYNESLVTEINGPTMFFVALACGISAYFLIITGRQR